MDTKTGAVPKKTRQYNRSQNREFASSSGYPSSNSSVFANAKKTPMEKVIQSSRKRDDTKHQFQCASTPFTDSLHFPSFGTELNVKSVTHKKKLNQDSKKKCNKFDKKLAEAEIDLYYSQYLQMKYLECQTKKAHETRAKYAMEKIQEAWQLVQLSMHKNSELQKQISVLTFLEELNEHLGKQNGILTPFLQIVPSFEKQYISISKAVDSMKHKLPVKDISLPNPGCEGEIIQLLQNMKSFLSNFLCNMKNLNKITTSSDILHSFASDSEQITANIKRCIVLLAEAKNLLLTETSYLLANNKMQDVP